MTKKDLNWLKKEIAKEMSKLEHNRNKKDGDLKYQTLRSVAEKIYQIDEPEVLSQEENVNIVLNDLKEYIKEQQSLSQNVGLAHTSAGNDTHYRQYDYVLECINEYEPSDELQNLLVSKKEITEEQVMDWLDKNDFYDHITAETVLERAVDKGELSYYGTKYSVIETPTIPKYVAEFIEEVKASGDSLDDAFSILRGIYHQSKTADWVAKENRNSETLARAWLDGYEVEEGPLYYALIKGHELVNDEGEWSTKYWNLWVSEGCVFPHDKGPHTDDFSIVMSKEEWGKFGINDTNADFIKVEENE